MIDFLNLDFGRIAGGASAACKRLPEAPAVYAFFGPQVSVPTEDPVAFTDAVNRLVERRASQVHAGTIGSLHKLTLDNRSSLGKGKQEALRLQAFDREFRLMLSDILSKSSQLQAPLYVGQTGQLRRRITQHVDPGSPLSTRLWDAGIAINECLLTYTDLPPNPLFEKEETMTLIEEILTRLLRPGFVGRIG